MPFFQDLLIANRRIQSYFLQKPGMSRTMIV